MDSASNPGGGLRSDVSDRAVTDILAHVGVKGMRWGVRKSDPYSTTHMVATNANPKVGGRTLDPTGAEAVILKVKPLSDVEFKSVFGGNLPASAKGYTLTTQNKAQYEALLSSSDSKQFPLHAPARAAKGAWDLARILQQSDSSEIAIGQEQTAQILEHIGVKGMRWGVRKSDRSSGSDGDSTIKVTTKSGKGIVKVSGGKGIDPSEDAVKVAAAKQKAKSSTTAALSNDEMRLLVGRMQLEQQYAKLLSESNQKKKSKGMEFGSWLLKAEGSARLKGKTGPVTEAVRLAMNVASAASPSTGKHVKKIK